MSYVLSFMYLQAPTSIGVSDNLLPASAVWKKMLKKGRRRIYCLKRFCYRRIITFPYSLLCGESPANIQRNVLCFTDLNETEKKLLVLHGY